MATSTKPRQLLKSQKKAAKKQHKNRHTLFKRNGIIPVDYATHHLVVANGGLDNNVSLDDLQRVFSMHGEVLDVVMQPQKSYAFISMSSTQHTEAAFARLHGHPLVRPDNVAIVPEVILYLDYVESVPGVAVPSSQHPPGLVLLEDFVTEDEEKALLEAVKWEQTDSHLSAEGGGVMKHRRVKHYGYEFLYGTNNVDPNRPLEHGIPAACRLVTDRLAASGRSPITTPDQLTINQYQPGQGIPPHVDTHSAFEDNIVSLSLGSQCVMDFDHPDGTTTLSVVLPRRSAMVMAGEARYMWTHGITPRNSDIVSVDVAGEGGPSRLTLIKRDTRTSFTFRKIRVSPCVCKYPAQCDSQQMQHKQAEKKRSALHLPKSDAEAQQIEREHVHQFYRQELTSAVMGMNFVSVFCDGATDVAIKEQELMFMRSVHKGIITVRFLAITHTPRPTAQSIYDEVVQALRDTGMPDEARKHKLVGFAADGGAVMQVYEEIADHFSDTRHTAWPRVAEFLNEQPEGATIVDVGCGNGKYLGVNKATFNVGCDRSAALCAICRRRGFPVFVADALHIPLLSHVADVIISIAVMHHMSTEARRQRAVEEIIRVLCPGGHALIYVWALEQEKDTVKSNYLKDTRIERKDCLKSEEEIGLLQAGMQRVSLNQTTECGLVPEPHNPPIKFTQDSGVKQHCDLDTQEGGCLTTDASSCQKLDASSERQEITVDKDAGVVTGDAVTSDVLYRTLPHGVASNDGASSLENSIGTVVELTTPGGATSTTTASVRGSTDPDVKSGRTLGLSVHVNRTHFEKQDLLVPWHSRPAQQKKVAATVIPDAKVADKVVHRFYHVFREGELEKLCLSVSGVRLIKSYYDKGNWCVVIKKEEL